MNKIRSQLEYLALAGGSLIVIAGAGLRRAWSERELLYLYLAAAVGIFTLTAGKIGADLNYQIELLLALALCAGWTLDRLQFFPILFQGERSNVTLLQMPLVLYAIVNLGIGVKTVVSRIALEPVRRRELAELRPLIENAHGRVISMQLDPLLHVRGRIDVEAELYAAPRYRTLSTAATDSLPAGSIAVGRGGLSDPEPIRRDLAEGKIPLVLLFEDIFGPQTLTATIEDLPTLPKSHLDAMRKRYRLARHVAGPLLDGDFIYEPIEDPERKAQ